MNLVPLSWESPCPSAPFCSEACCSTRTFGSPTAPDRGDCPTLAYVSQARRAPSSFVLLMLSMLHGCVGSPCCTCTVSLPWSRPRRRRLLRRRHPASTRRSLQCRSRRNTAPPRTYGAWNAAAVTLAGHGGGAPSTRTSRASRPLPTTTRHDGFHLSLLSRPPSLSGTGVLPQDVSRRGLPRRGPPLVPLPCLICLPRLPCSLPEGRVSDSTCRWVGIQRKHES